MWIRSSYRLMLLLLPMLFGLQANAGLLKKPLALDESVARWSYVEDATGEVFPAKPAKSLIPQLPSPSRCCRGTYKAELNLKKLGLDSVQGSPVPSYSILIPITGGLKKVVLDEFEVQFPERDYTSIETLVPVPAVLFGRDHVTLSVVIDSPPSFYAGMWNTAPILGDSAELLAVRDKNYTFQILVPYFLAIFLTLFAAIFFWCWKQVQSRDPLYGEFAITLAAWGVYYLFLAGQIRAWLPFFGGMFHMPMRLLAITALMRVLSIFAGVPRSQLRKITYIGIAIGVIQISANLAYIEKLQPFFFIPFQLFIVYANIKMFRSIKTRLNLIVFVASTVASIGFLSDTIRIGATLLDFNYPIFYLNRYTTPPLLLTSVVYLAYKLSKEAEVSVKQQAYEQVSSQVAHDIRSPLAALAVAERDLKALPEDTRVMIRSAVRRIQDIANQLLDGSRSFSDGSKSLVLKEPDHVIPQLLPSVIDGIISEKRFQFRSKIGVEIESLFQDETYGIFVSVRLSEFKRVLSNLINNAVEAMVDGNGSVQVSIKATGSAKDNIEILIRDSGKGIAPEVLEELMQRGVTHGKEGGLGLGLSHARTTLEAWGGQLRLESVVGVGTTAVITLPKARPPSWFVECLRIREGTQVAVLDDDDSIHQIWKGRFESAQLYKKGIVLHHFSTPEDIVQWHKALPQTEAQALYLVDYELLNHTKTGLDVVEELGVAHQSILITSRYEEPAIRKRCARSQTLLIPKGMAGFVPIQVESDGEGSADKLDLILIDDDPIVRMAWSSSANQNSKRIRVFPEPTSFLKIASSANRNTPIYVDAQLGENLHGEEVAQELYDLGFSEIYLATGFDPSSFDLAASPWIKGVVGKSAPWT